MLHVVRLTAALSLVVATTFGASASGDEVSPAPQDIRSCYKDSAAAPDWTALCIRQAQFFADTCGAIERLAVLNRLAEGFFARLIWQESHFDPGALSLAGAQGIAQFIPSTARLQGLRDAFDPAEALTKSARYLRFLTGKYGNLGLAAVAYNGGEGRATRYVGGIGYLPAETRYYVEIITGAGPDAWLAETPPVAEFALDKSLPFTAACVKMAEAEAVPRLDRPPGEWHPWGVLLAENFVQSTAVARFERMQAKYPDLLGSEKLMLLMARNPSFGPRLRHFAMIGRDDRQAAEALCAGLQKAGGACVVRKN